MANRMTLTLWRGVGGFLLLLLGYLVAAFVIEFLTAIANGISHGWPSLWSRYFAAVASAIIGTAAGWLLASGVLKALPRRGVALAFIFLNVWIIVGDLIYPGPTTALQIVRAVVCIGATLAMVWPGDKLAARLARA